MVEQVQKMAAMLGKREESESLESLCEAAVEELKGLLRPGVTPEDCGSAFVLAAAWLALEGALAGEEDVEAFTAGEVSFRRGAGGERRRALRMQAMQVMKPWLRDEGFSFRGVRG